MTYYSKSYTHLFESCSYQIWPTDLSSKNLVLKTFKKINHIIKACDSLLPVERLKNFTVDSRLWPIQTRTHISDQSTLFSILGYRYDDLISEKIYLQILSNSLQSGHLDDNKHNCLVIYTW